MKIKARLDKISRFNSVNIGCDFEIFDSLRDGNEVDVKDEDVANKLISRGICIKANKVKKSKSKSKEK